MKSIIQSEKKCFVCGTTQDLHTHHVFEGTANRSKSEKDGLKIYLCGKHHNLSLDGIHYNKTLDLALKKYTQAVYEKTHSREEFIRRYGRSYL